MFRFKMNYNLLQNRHDKITNQFIYGKINLHDYLNYETNYNKIKHLYIINLN